MADTDKAPKETGQDEACEECVTTSEKALAILGIGFALLIGAMAIDLLTGGALSRLLPSRGE